MSSPFDEMLSPSEPNEFALSRKANKPLMEKRRRARINKSLIELKAILMDTNKKEAPGHSKWEKADILEMTVEYVRGLRTEHKETNSNKDAISIGQFLSGYAECVRQVKHYTQVNHANKSLTLTQTHQLQQLNDYLIWYLKKVAEQRMSTLITESPTPDESIASSVCSAGTSPSGSSLSDTCTTATPLNSPNWPNHPNTGFPSSLSATKPLKIVVPKEMAGSTSNETGNSNKSKREEPGNHNYLDILTAAAHFTQTQSDTNQLLLISAQQHMHRNGRLSEAELLSAALAASTVWRPW